ncbi:glycogen debranching enzyme GlgX, partial [Mesorhizobium sp. M2E.F.Ca.ET.209.01.1.1]
GALGSLATRLARSSDVFGRDGQPASRTVNFIAAHDGMALADIVAYERKHNEANGEQNRDGHNDNLSWNNGAEGETDETAIGEARFNDQCALLATLFASR